MPVLIRNLRAGRRHRHHGGQQLQPHPAQRRAKAYKMSWRPSSGKAHETISSPKICEVEKQMMRSASRWVSAAIPTATIFP